MYKKFSLTLIAYLLCSTGLFFLLIKSAQAEYVAKLTFIDVGEGDAILIESAGESTLIDSGNLISAYAVNNYLFQNKIEKLNSLILTHPHPDHIGGSFFIAQAYKPDLFADNGEDLSNYQNQEIFRWYTELRSKFSTYRKLKTGDQIKTGQALLKVLWPSKPGITEDWNANSLVISLEVGGFKALLMGDANSLTEKFLMTEKASLKADILKVGHHGASDCCQPAFINTVSPKYCVISSNEDTLNTKPDKEVLQRLKKKCMPLLTSQKGNVVVEIKADGDYKVTS